MFSSSPNPQILSIWKPLPLGFNLDRSTVENLGKAVMGGIIRSNEDTTILSISGPVGVYSISKMEPKDLCNGLREAHHASLQMLLVEGSSACVIRWAVGTCTTPWAFADVVEEIHDLARDMVVSFNHVKRSANSMADTLDKEGVTHPSLVFCFP